jgi:hypothetical protein
MEPIALTVDAAMTLGVVEGGSFASRQIAAICDRMATADSVDAAAVLVELGQVWEAKHLDEIERRRLALVERGADVVALSAYELAHWNAYAAGLQEAAARVRSAQQSPSKPETETPDMGAIDG